MSLFILRMVLYLKSQCIGVLPIQCSFLKYACLLSIILQFSTNQHLSPIILDLKRVSAVQCINVPHPIAQSLMTVDYYKDRFKTQYS